VTPPLTMILPTFPPQGGSAISTYTVRVRPQTYTRLADLARQHDESLTDALDRLVEEWRRFRIFEEASRAYAAMAAYPVSNAAWRAEIAAWDVTVGDGLEQEPDDNW
jgi:hypothetical protein